MTKPTLSLRRGAEIFSQMLQVRRWFCADTDFFKMTDFWEDLIGEEGFWRIRRYRSTRGDDYLRRAAVNVLGHHVTLTVDEELWSRAEKGAKFANFVLAHEIGHLALEHHATGGIVRNYQLFRVGNNMANVPPTAEELEANFAGVFLQCGVALKDKRWGASELAERAFTDVDYVRKAQGIVRLEAFGRERERQQETMPKHPRVIL